VVVSQADPTVPTEAARYIEERIACDRVETLVLSESGHHVAADVERELVADAVVDWFT
jgi:esterase/lipase